MSGGLIVNGNTVANSFPHDGFVPWPPEFAERYRQLGFWRGQTLHAMLHQRAQQTPKQTAIVCGERRWSYATLETLATQAAHGFFRLGITRNDRVVVQLPNIGEFFVAVFALFKLGAIPVFALPPHRQTEIEYFIAHADAKAWIIVDNDNGFDYCQLARRLSADAQTLQHIIVVGDAKEFIAFADLIAPAAENCAALCGAVNDASAVAFLQLSGGSTGLPKLIPRTHDDYLYSVRESAAICALDVSSIYLCALPAAHNFALSSPGSLGIFFAGGCVVLARNPAPDACFALIERERVSITAVVPPLAQLWLDAAPSSARDLSSLQLLQVGGARLATEIALRIRPVLGCKLQQVFGMAEGLVNYTRLDDDASLVSSTQGRPISPSDEIRIVDDDDVDVPAGNVGHLLTRGPYTLRGYYRAAEHNQRAFTHDGFYRTGDIVRQLSSGHLIVEGRVKDQINRGGDKIAAEEIEHHLLAHPAVRGAAIVAMPDKFLGEKSCAFVVCRDTAPRAIELKRYLHERGIAAYKIPDRIEFLSQLPLTGVGKINKRALREQLLMAKNSSTTA